MTLKKIWLLRAREIAAVLRLADIPLKAWD
jgi:hypothetical protein